MKKHGLCKMCLQEKKLVKSHVIPEWAYKRMYDAQHRILRILPNQKAPVGYKSTGEWDRFLCEDCEGSLQPLDEYGRAIVYSDPSGPTFGIETGGAGHGMNIVNVDYARLKLFQLSVLWRASVSKREFFAEIDLEAQESVLREMLLRNDPGDSSSYGCIVSVVRPKPNQILDLIMDPPASYTDQGWTIARFLYAGCIWFYVVSADASDFPLSRFFARPGHPLPLLITELEEIPGLVKRLQDIENLWRSRPNGDDTAGWPTF